MNYSYEGIGALVGTFPFGTAQVGEVCKVSIYGNVDKCSSGEKFCGIVLDRSQGMAAVQVEGFVTVGYSGTKFSCGYVTLTADGTGKVIANANGREYLVVQVDEATKTAVIKL